MNTTKTIILFTLISILLIPAISEALEIRPEPYIYRMAMVRDVAVDTFVISEKITIRDDARIGCRISMVYFDLGSSHLSPLAAETLLSDLKRCECMRSTPLQVTGHACQLGPERLNHSLSLQRAGTVADFLQKQGITVSSVQGRGAQQPVTEDPKEFSKNRRVEITMQP